MLETTSNGVPYTWELAGSEGAAFILFPEPEHTKEQVNAAIAELRFQRDVVHLRLANDDDRDHLYRREIFRMPQVRPLRWYQVYETPELIRQHRRQGTTPADYVTQFVLPNIELATTINLEKYGDKIYSF